MTINTQLMLHCGGVPATLDDLRAVPVPEASGTHAPIPHAYLVERVLAVMQPHFNLEVGDMAFGLARDGAQMFGVIGFRNPGEQRGPVVGVRGSYDKSLAGAAAVGDRVFVCDNLAFSGSAVTVMRKNTTNAVRDLDGILVDAGARAGLQYQELVADMDALMGLPCDTTEGYGHLGKLFGLGKLTSTQLNRAMEYWRTPPHPEHAPRTVHSLYQAVNHALKLAPPSRALGQYVDLHEWAMDQRDRATVVLDVQADGGAL